MFYWTEEQKYIRVRLSFGLTLTLTLSKREGTYMI